MSAGRVATTIFGGIVGIAIAVVTITALPPMPAIGHIAIGCLCALGGMAIADTFYDVLH